MTETSKTPKREHKLGTGTGYETDGTNYWLAPTYVNSWGAILDQARALDALIEATMRSAHDIRRHVEAQRRQWWASVYKDLGLDASVTYNFNSLEGKLSPEVKEDKG